MLLVTRTGVRTCLSWWTRMSVVGRAIVLMDTSDEPEPKLVVAEEASVEDAMRLLVVIEDRIRLRARRFDIRSWNGDTPPPPAPSAPAKAGGRGGGVSVGCLMREEIVGWDQDTLVRLLWDGDVLEVEVDHTTPGEPIGGWRNRLGNSRKALLGRPGGEGFDLRSEADYCRFGNALEALVPLEGSGSTDALIPAEAHSHWFVPTGCSDGCVLHIRAYSPDEDDAGWISIDLISNAKTRRDGSIRGRLANALGASLGHVGWATWCPLLMPAALRAALASASSVAFPHLEHASSVPRRGIAKDKDNGKDGNR